MSRLTPLEQNLLTLIVSLEEAVRSMASPETSGAKPDLLPLFQQIDEATCSLPRGTDPDLLHYLHKKSFEKARLWLEGRENENARGGCDR